MTMIEKNCKACGDIITVRLADHKRGWGNFCDKACSAAHKCGMRPRDVNEYHAECQGGHGWAADMLKKFAEKYPDGKPPKAPKVGAQAGRVKVVHKLHYPQKKQDCVECGAPTDGGRLCPKCEEYKECMDAMETGWDGHKAW